MPSTPNYDEDIDDIMASIHQGQHSPTPPPRQAQPEPPKRQLTNTAKDSTFAKPTQSIFTCPTTAPAAKPQPKKARKKQSWKLKRPVKIVLFVLLLLMLLAVPGYFYQDKIKATVSDLLAPPSPFNQELVEKAGFPLYYPTKLPGTFKMETDNISSDNNVVLFKITDNDGKRINITLQKKPSGLNLEPLNELLTDKGELDTKFGKLMIGTSKEEMELANIVTDKTWIIVSTPKDTLSDDQFTEIINSLKVVDTQTEE